MENEAENENNATSDSDDGPALDLETLEALDLERDELRRLQLEMIDEPDDDDELPEAPPALQAPALPIDRRPQVTEGGRFRPSDVACAKRQTNWRVWFIGRSSERPESPGIAIVSPGMSVLRQTFRLERRVSSRPTSFALSGCPALHSTS